MHHGREDSHEFSEHIDMEIRLNGDITSEEREKLFAVSRQCPVHKMLKSGIEMHSFLAGAANIKR
ncbi:MAG: hypothetical protein M1510_07730 [Nitrospirae bacterium]|nr:hypothetical protein [Nitrospirota bacterium]